MTKEIRTNELAVAQAIASPYQRELLAQLGEQHLGEIGEFAYPDADPAREDLGPLELRVGDRTLTLPAREPGLAETLAGDKQPYVRMWGRLYTEMLEFPGTNRYWLDRMDRIAGEEIGSRPAARPPSSGTTVPICRNCGFPGGHHADSCQSPEAREQRGLEPIRPARRRRP